MKIVARSGPKTVLIEATHDEVAHLFGKKWAGRDEFARENQLSTKELRIGTEINVDAAFQYVGWIYAHRERFDAIANRLREAADSVGEFPALFEHLSIDPEKNT